MVISDPYGSISLFRDLTPTQRGLLQRIFSPCQYENAIVLFEQGEPALCLYLVLEGEISLRYKPDDGSEITLTRVRPGGVVGWSAALGGPVYTSSAVCTSDCSLLQVSGRDLRILCETHPQIGEIILERLAEIIAQRQSKTNQNVVDLLERSLRRSMKIEKTETD